MFFNKILKVNIKIIILTFLISLGNINEIKPDHCGGSIAAGVLGGFGAGALVGSSINRRPRKVVYVQQSEGRSRTSERELARWEDELNDREDELDRKERALNKKAKYLAKKENALNKREQQKNIIKQEEK